LPSNSIEGVCSLILFPLFATGVVDTGGKLPPVSLTPVANLPPVSTRLAKLMEKFATGVVDTGGIFAAGVIEPAAILPPVLMGYSGTGGKLIHEKNQKQKIS
jgi:hypothetical protein